MRSALRLVFAGTPAFGLPLLPALAGAGHDIIAVYTQPDRPAGRGRHLQSSPIKQWALQQALPVYQPLNFKAASTIDALAALEPDVMVVVAYGLILPQRVLDIPRLGCVNVHASLLPRWRGAAPIQHAILAGDRQSGVTIMQMDRGMDTGDMLASASCVIDSHETAASLHDKLVELAVQPLLSSLQALASGTAQPERQAAHQATYAPKIQKAQAQIDWNGDAGQVDRLVRAYDPWPGAYTVFGQGQQLRIISGTPLTHSAKAQPAGTILSIDKSGLLTACKEGAYRIERLQWPGRKAMSVRDWFNGHHQELAAGDCFAGGDLDE
ncbi:MAG: methionyl-tRNA formyltransferase [Legionellaceae bacterium]|nr:methionyl-tRNA formyltransferase [Legionellaceae bacterium]